MLNMSKGDEIDKLRYYNCRPAEASDPETKVFISATFIFSHQITDEQTDLNLY